MKQPPAQALGKDGEKFTRKWKEEDFKDWAAVLHIT